MSEILDAVISVFDIIFQDVLKPIQNIAMSFTFLIKIAIWTFKILIWAVQFIIFLVQVLLAVPADFFASILAIVSSVLLAIPQTIINFIQIGSDTFAKFVVSGFWGWDKVPTSTNDFKYSKFIKSQQKQNKCYTAPDGRVPFSVLMGTIIMPPIGVFMTLGLTGWFHILLATLLTLAFYFPGLLYALVIIYS